MRIILLFTLLIGFSNLSAQEPVNQYDSNGKKHGTWIVWLDKDWKLAKDSMSAVYFRYNYFDHGKSVYGMGPWGGKLEAKTNSLVKKGNALMLDGEYSWYNAKGKLVCTHVLKNGWYVSFKEYYSNGQLQTFFDYAKKYKGQEYSYYFCSYNKKGELTFEGWEFADENGFRMGSKGVDN
jgi:hypothetical protein